MHRSLDDLLLEWEERRQRGEIVSAAFLCPDSPSDAAELERRIRLLECLDPFLTVSAEEEPSPPVAEPLPEQIGGYQVQKVLGRGGNGIVYEAWDPSLQRTVAVKVLRPSVPVGGLTDAGRLAHRFEREAQSLAKLKHPHIVPIYHAGLHNGEPYFVMEYVTGGSLVDQRKALTQAGPRQVVRCLEKVARAVDHAHQHGILHRDLKPGNILLDPERGPVVSDFGLAKLLDARQVPTAPSQTCADPPGPGASPQGEVAIGVTAPGCQPGTPPYMAPEQFDASFGPIGPATDIWALGVILYELLTGEKPFPGPTREKCREQVCGGHFKRPRSVCPRLDPRLERVILRCLALSSRERYPSAAALAKDLAAWQKPSRRVLVIVVLGAILLAVGGVGGLLSLLPRNPEKAYRRQVDALLAELRQGRQVELIPPYPAKEDFFTLRCGTNGTEVKRVQDGLTIHCPARCGLVELLPEVPARSYRVRARMRWERQLTQEREWGVYVNHRCAVTGQGAQHFFVVVYFSLPTEVKDGPVVRHSLRGSFRPRLFGELANPTDRPIRDFYGVRKKGRPNHTDLEYTPDPKDRWVNIEITVRPARVAASFRPGGAAAELPLLRPADLDGAKQYIRTTYPDLERGALEGSALGVYVRQAVCTVQGFTVEPVDDDE